MNTNRKSAYFKISILLTAMMAATTAFAESNDKQPNQVDSKVMIAANDTNSAKPQKASLYTRLGEMCIRDRS